METLVGSINQTTYLRPEFEITKMENRKIVSPSSVLKDLNFAISNYLISSFYESSYSQVVSLMSTSPKEIRNGLTGVYFSGRST